MRVERISSDIPRETIMSRTSAHYPAILFLDIDGVLNTYNSISEFGRNCFTSSSVEELNRILEAVPCGIVIHSTSRKHLSFDKLMDIFHDNDVIDSYHRIIGTTEARITDRYYAILFWLFDHCFVAPMVILNAWSSLGGFERSLFQTNPEYGLTPKIADQVIEYFQSELNTRN